MRTKLSPVSNHSQGSHVKDSQGCRSCTGSRKASRSNLEWMQLPESIKVKSLAAATEKQPPQTIPGEARGKESVGPWVGWVVKVGVASLEIREIKGLGLKMFQKEYEGMNQYFCISLLRILVVFTVNVLFSSTLIFSKFSPYIRSFLNVLKALNVSIINL